MKRKVAITSTVAALGVFLIVGTGAAQAQNAQGAGGTRIAVVNMFVISTGYERIKQFKEEVKSLAEPYEAKIKEYQKGYEAWKNALEAAGGDAKKHAEAQKNTLAFKRALEDKVAERNKILMEKTDQYVVTLYKEIESGVARYAKANGIHVVFYYFEPTDEPYSSRNVQQKLGAASGSMRATNPIYMADGIDISQQVLQVLNSQYPGKGTVPASAGGN